MVLRLLFILFLSFNSWLSFSQGNIDHIKNQKYLEGRTNFDCNNHSGDNLLARICANLAFQKSDSVLVNVYDSLLSRIKEKEIDSAEYKIIKMQTTWRKFRDEHCRLIYDKYQGCNGCSERSVAYLDCLRELTESRIKELRTLSSQLLDE